MRFNVARSAVTCLACGLFLGGALMLASCEPAHITPPPVDFVARSLDTWNCIADYEQAFVAPGLQGLRN